MRETSSDRSSSGLRWRVRSPDASSRLRRGLSVRVEQEGVAEIAHSQGRPLPQRQHHEVLRVREPERLEDGSVETDDTAAGRGESEADLTVESERIFHSPSLTRTL